MNTLVVLESNRGDLHRLSKEAIVAAQGLGGEVSAIILGKDAEIIASELINVKLEEIIMVKNEYVNSYNADGYTEIISNVIKQESPKNIVLGHTYQTRDFAPRLSARLNIPFIPDLIFSHNEQFTKQVLNAKLNASIKCASDQKILSFQSAAFSEENLISGQNKTRLLDISINSSIIRSKSEDPFQESAGDVDLESAEVLVSVGRGIEKEENIPLAFNLAELLNAEVSASRPVVDSGWLESFRQVGSSGNNVSPNLYFSLGVSGAIQHVVGMKGAKNILAINKDKEAPIFEIADYAAVGDVLEIIPKLIENLKEQ
jgi:electron transfer flavoprotein alpha subunit